MSRPIGSGSFDEIDVGLAIERIRHRDRLGRRWPTRWSVATEVAVTESGLKQRHLRMGMPWDRYRGFCVRSVSAADAPVADHQLHEVDPGSTRRIDADALLRLARQEDRHPRLQAARL